MNLGSTETYSVEISNIYIIIVESLNIGCSNICISLLKKRRRRRRRIALPFGYVAV
jgi:predicted nucleic acid-binding Zn ribbon protein